MVEIKQLQIGFWLSYKGEPIKVVDILGSADRVRVKDHEELISLSDLAPLPMTTDVLEAAGFEKFIDNSSDVEEFGEEPEWKYGYFPEGRERGWTIASSTGGNGKFMMCFPGTLWIEVSWVHQFQLLLNAHYN